MEKFLVNCEFLKFFVECLFLPSPEMLIDVKNSIVDPELGKTDLLQRYEGTDKDVVVMFENKLSADFQTDHYIRYLKRSIKYSDTFLEVYIVFIAPQLPISFSC